MTYSTEMLEDLCTEIKDYFDKDAHGWQLIDVHCSPHDFDSGDLEIYFETENIETDQIHGARCLLGYDTSTAWVGVIAGPGDITYGYEALAEEPVEFGENMSVTELLAGIKDKLEERGII